MPQTETSSTKRRLGPHDWIIAGFEALTRGGPEAIRIEAIARNLSTTKGSFYWHFKDLKALHLAMLAAWERLATTSVTTPAHLAGRSATERLSWLITRLSHTCEDEGAGSALEPAVRDWGRAEPLAHAVLERVDRRRLTDLAALFIDAGLLRSEAQAAANRFYAVLLGLDALRLTTMIDMAAVLRGIAEMALGRSLSFSGRLTSDGRVLSVPHPDPSDSAPIVAAPVERCEDPSAAGTETADQHVPIWGGEVVAGPVFFDSPAADICPDTKGSPTEPPIAGTGHAAKMIPDRAGFGPLANRSGNPFKTIRPWSRAGP